MAKKKGTIRKKKNKQNKKPKRFFNDNYAVSWRYLKESKNYIYGIIVLFLLTTFIGYMKPIFFVSFIENLLLELVKKTSSLSLSGLVLFILYNNIKNSFLSLVFGIILGIMPLLTALFNGYVLGFVANRAVAAEGASVLLKLVPHGIFEFPALIISLALGTRLGFQLVKGWKTLLSNLENSFRVFVFIVLPLLLVAGIIEGLLIWFVG